MTFEIGSDHFLKDHSDFPVDTSHWATVQSKNKKKFPAGHPDTIVMHYTAGRNARSSAKYLAKPDVKASAHLVIGRDGEIYQLAPFDVVTWHAGKSSYGGRKGFNKYSIGIEMDNAGPLSKVGSKFQSWFGQSYQDHHVVRATHRNEHQPRHWHTYTEKQLLVTTAIVESIISHYQDTDGASHIQHILGHEEISVGRKQDPGPAFDLDQFRKNLLGTAARRDDEAFEVSTGTVAANKLNIRSDAGVHFDKVAKPLQKGQAVEIIDEENGWYKVQTTVEGWVSKGYIADIKKKK